jgi:hypothetical protein
LRPIKTEGHENNSGSLRAYRTLASEEVEKLLLSILEALWILNVLCARRLVEFADDSVAWWYTPMLSEMAAWMLSPILPPAQLLHRCPLR